MNILMLYEWCIDGKSGNVIFPKGEVVYQKLQQNGSHVVIEPIYQTSDGRRFILLNTVDGDDAIEVKGRKYLAADGRTFEKLDGMLVLTKSTNINDVLHWVYTNPFNGYCYRQDGQ